jgi:hypothetical protein
MCEFCLYYIKPNGLSPHIGDTDNARLQKLSHTGIMDHRYLLSIAAVLFKRMDFAQAAGMFHEEALWLLGSEGLYKFHSTFDPVRLKAPTLTSSAFIHGGFYVIRHNDLYMAVHCSVNGRRGTGNHSHNDMLSFELYAYDKSFIIDPGTYLYTADPQSRNLFRSTAYHNTVMVDGEEINRLSPDRLFELEDDASPQVHAWEMAPEFDFLDVEHNGYKRLDQPVVHRRQFYFEKTENYWIVRDLLSGEGKHRLVWSFHFDAGIKLAVSDELTVETHCQDSANLVLQPVSDVPLDLALEEGWISPSYGLKEKAWVARYSCHVEVPMSVTFLLYPYRAKQRGGRAAAPLVEAFEHRWGRPA